MNNISVKPHLLTKRIFLGGVAIVVASTAALSKVTDYGTALFQIVVLGAWSVVAAVTSGTFAEQHHLVVWPVAVVLNVALFGVPATILFWLLRRRAPRSCAVLLASWFLFYVASLFFLFPATDGP